MVDPDARRPVATLRNVHYGSRRPIPAHRLANNLRDTTKDNQDHDDDDMTKSFHSTQRGLVTRYMVGP